MMIWCDFLPIATYSLLLLAHMSADPDRKQRAWGRNTPAWHGRVHMHAHACAVISACPPMPTSQVKHGVFENGGDPMRVRCASVHAVYAALRTASPCLAHARTGARMQLRSCTYLACSLQDIFFGREDRLEPQQRSRLPFVQMLREEAADAHAEYARLPPDQRAVYT